MIFNPLKKFKLDEIVPTEDDNFFRNFQIHGVVHDEGAAMMNGVSGNAGLFSTATDLRNLILFGWLFIMQLFLFVVFV